MKENQDQRLFLYESDFVQARPVLAGDIDFAGGGILCYSVEDVGIAGLELCGQQAAAVDGGSHLAVAGIDDEDGVGGIDIGPDLPVDVFKLVQITDRFPVEGDLYGTLHVELPIHEIEAAGAVGGDELFAIGGDAPALAGVGIALQEFKRGGIIDEGDLVGPCEDVQLAVEHYAALAEVLPVEINLIEDFAALEIHGAKRGFPPLPGALIQFAVIEEKTLRVCMRVVIVLLHDLDLVFLDLGLAAATEDRCEKNDKKTLHTCTKLAKT